MSTVVPSTNNESKLDSVRDRFNDIFAHIAKTAGARDSSREHPFAEVAELKAQGFGALRVPVDLGGAGISYTELMDIVIDLGKADPNIAHAFRNHFATIESALLNPNAPTSRFFLEAAARGETIGGAFSELTTAVSGGADFSTVFKRSGDRYSLTGTKHYTTGNLYADWLSVNAVRDDGKHAMATIPASREGIERPLDWDGIGQRLTGSGSTKFTNVDVAPEEILDVQLDARAYRAVFHQLYLSAVIAGIMENIQDDAIALVKNRSRNFYHGLADLPRQESGVQEIVGQISTNAWIARTVVQEAARGFERCQQQERAHGDDEGSRMQSSLAAARVKVVVDELGPVTANLLFEAGGGQTVRSGTYLDRHWRNIKTLSAHNPRVYKLRVIGDYELNGAPLPRGGFF
ncbi:acyl-CoA dehydrogenase [Pseudomonas sp. v388]|uniref:acyl-CoA dehydrogenase family protein n=1 Tax=Pseudomonas sp. v388 TaxID=2479849 RepID=UPI000F7B9747|nr:acyl-CoA dehydrogenase family protein [Pseudomonas sp. v388]RRV10467.1 acyl-CoA dehydrogenase [Pseudomonas sp. v388]